MFRYPIISSNKNLYTRLGLTPDAKPEDITNAKNEILKSLNAEKNKLEKRLALVKEKLPELSIKKERIQELKNESDIKSTKHKEYQKLLTEIAEMEKEAQRIDPDFKKLDSEIEKVNKKINEINIMRLENEAERIKYDAANPPCSLLKLEEFSSELLTNNSTRLFLIRKSLTDFFEKEKNINCYNPSDFTRNIFLTDYEYNQLIDEEEI